MGCGDLEGDCQLVAGTCENGQCECTATFDGPLCEDFAGSSSDKIAVIVLGVMVATFYGVLLLWSLYELRYIKSDNSSIQFFKVCVLILEVLIGVSSLDILAIYLFPNPSSVFIIYYLGCFVGMMAVCALTADYLHLVEKYELVNANAFHRFGYFMYAYSGVLVFLAALFLIIYEVTTQDIFRLLMASCIIVFVGLLIASMAYIAFKTKKQFKDTAKSARASSVIAIYYQRFTVLFPSAMVLLFITFVVIIIRGQLCEVSLWGCYLSNLLPRLLVGIVAFLGHLMQYRTSTFKSVKSKVTSSRNTQSIAVSSRGVQLKADLSPHSSTLHTTSTLPTTSTIDSTSELNPSNNN